MLRRIALVIAGVGLILLFVFVLGVGRWLVVEDPLQKADAIAVLSGRMPLRALEAAKLYRAGYAKEIWLTHSSEPGESLHEMGIQYVGEEMYNRQVLVHEGVPPEAIHDLEPPIENTADEIKTIAAALEKEHGTSVILVTSKVHTRRARALWHRLAGENPLAIVRGASDDPYQPSRWWRTSGDALDVMREMLGLLNAWAGLPLHPVK